MNYNDAIRNTFNQWVNKARVPGNAFVRVYCPSRSVDIQLAASLIDKAPLPVDQPNYLASCGKLFTATLVAQLVEAGKLGFYDPIGHYLDPELMSGLHLYRGQDYSDQITVRHLLSQTSGLPDHFWPLLKRLVKEPGFDLSTREAIEWSKTHMKPRFRPGQGFNYTDINYHLLGLILEQIEGEPFHDILHRQLFQPLGMTHSSVLHCSAPAAADTLPVADFYLDKTAINPLKAYAALDYAGGSVVAPLNEALIFMQALVNHQLISQETLTTMQSDKTRFNPIIDYGYGIWQLSPTFLILPQKYQCWGVVGATGAFMFYHPGLEAYLIGNFNSSRYMRKGVRFLMSLIKALNP